MATLLERLQQALTPQFAVLREIAGGGMGRVFLGHDIALDRRVAIKVLRPEMATAVGAERFVREARLLARLRHPHIVPVFQGGEADGLLYHVLEYQDGETLAQRLVRGPLTRSELTVLADGLLAALAAAHQAGVVHRDIKPGNIFLVGGRAVVGDFGIAHSDTTGETLTEAGQFLGTRAYMAPEQLRGAASTAQTDLFAAGLVLVEAATGRRLDGPAPAGAGLWGGVPRSWVRPLRRALAESPGQRWPTAEALARSLRGEGRVRALAGIGLTVALAAVVVMAWWWPSGGASSAGAPPFEPFVVRLDPFSTTTSILDDAVATGLRRDLAQGLTGFPDFVADTGEEPLGASRPLRIGGSVGVRADSLVVTLHRVADDLEPIPLGLHVAQRGAPGLVDSLVGTILDEIWRGDHRGEVLPREALPVTLPGRAQFLRAERSYAAGDWSEALERYETVERADRSCVLCAYRIRDLHRWLNRENDTLRLRTLLDARMRFTPPYRALIEAGALPPGPRLEALRGLRDRLDGFFDFHYLLGDELLHRGPLHGYPRRRAIEHLRRAAELRPDFAGAAEHLVWAYVAEGDSVRAGELLAGLERDHPPRDPYAAVLRTLHRLAHAWRLQEPSAAAALTARELSSPGIASSRDLAAGPRALPAFGAVLGTVALGQRLAAITERPELVVAGLVAQALGHTALGQEAAAATAARTLTGVAADPEWELAELQLASLAAILGEAPVGPEVAGRLKAFLGRASVTGALARRAEWTRGLLQLGDSVAGGRSERGPLQQLAQARREAAGGRLVEALRLTDSLTNVDYREVDPFAGAIARLDRAEWYRRLGRWHDADRELLWHEHSDFAQIPRGTLQAAEVDWAVATLALWRRAAILAAGGGDPSERCRVYREIERRWREGDAVPRARADSARLARASLPDCAAPG